MKNLYKTVREKQHVYRTQQQHSEDNHFKQNETSFDFKWLTNKLHNVNLCTVSNSHHGFYCNVSFGDGSQSTFIHISHHLLVTNQSALKRLNVYYLAAYCIKKKGRTSRLRERHLS